MKGWTELFEEGKRKFVSRSLRPGHFELTLSTVFGDKCPATDEKSDIAAVTTPFFRGIIWWFTGCC